MFDVADPIKAASAGCCPRAEAGAPFLCIRYRRHDPSRRPRGYPTIRTQKVREDRAPLLGRRRRATFGSPAHRSWTGDESKAAVIDFYRRQRDGFINPEAAVVPPADSIVGLESPTPDAIAYALELFEANGARLTKDFAELFADSRGGRAGTLRGAFVAASWAGRGAAAGVPRGYSEEVVRARVAAPPRGCHADISRGSSELGSRRRRGGATRIFRGARPSSVAATPRGCHADIPRGSSELGRGDAKRPRPGPRRRRRPLEPTFIVPTRPDLSKVCVGAHVRLKGMKTPGYDGLLGHVLGRARDGATDAVYTDRWAVMPTAGKMAEKAVELRLTTQPDLAKGEPLRPLAIRESSLVVAPEAAPADVEEAD